MDTKDYYYQIDNIEYVKNKLGTEPWIQASGEKAINKSDASFWCGLIDPSKVAAVLKECSWDIRRDASCYPGFEESMDNEYTYKSCLLDDGFEPILIYREFYGVKPDYVEISQEFVLLNNLYYESNSKKYYFIHPNGESEEVVRCENDKTIFIKSKYLFKYAAAKQKCLIFYYDIRTSISGSLDVHGLEAFDEDYSDKCIRYSIWGNELPSSATYNSYSVLMGKKIFPPASVDKSGYWPFEPYRKYEEYIIGINEIGEQITHSSNPDTLNNFFNANPHEPLYFTPVYFNKEVLQKYVSKPELYEITDGRLSCRSLWSIEIDNHHRSNSISVFLGDLGTYLPEEEQPIWKAYNIVGDEPLSEVTFKRDFLCLPVESNMEDHRFHTNYISLNNNWGKRFGWCLFLPLSTSDEYNFSGIRIPITNSLPEFDGLVLSLVKVLIDSLNEKELLQQANLQAEEKQNLKSIGKLEAWLVSQCVSGFEEHIQFLRDLQELRSTGTGHRKGKGYEKTSEKFGLNRNSYTIVFTEILQKANMFIEYMDKTFIKPG